MLSSRNNKLGYHFGKSSSPDLLIGNKFFSYKTVVSFSLILNALTEQELLQGKFLLF